MGLTIGQLAKAAGVGVETVRYYQRRGLLGQPARAGSRFRKYDADAVRQLRLIRRAKELGFTLSEIAELLELSWEDTGCAEVRERADVKLTAIDEKMADLQRMRNALHQLTSRCRRRAAGEPCPILEALEPEPNEPR